MQCCENNALLPLLCSCSGSPTSAGKHQHHRLTAHSNSQALHSTRWSLMLHRLTSHACNSSITTHKHTTQTSVPHTTSQLPSKHNIPRPRGSSWLHTIRPKVLQPTPLHTEHPQYPRLQWQVTLYLTNTRAAFPTNTHTHTQSRTCKHPDC
jgi:hypothetical protein